MKSVSQVFADGVPQSSAVQVSPGLGVDRETIPADGTTPATFHYQRKNGVQTTVVVTVNGAVQSPLTLDGTGAVEFEVTALTPGPVEVSANGDSITIQAV
jgi:hypothetical protein